MTDESPANESPATRRSRTRSEAASGTDTSGTDASDADERERTDGPDGNEGGWVDRSGPAARPSEVSSTGEPDEFDPTRLGPDPPSVSVPDPSDAEVPADVARVFWSLVVVLNIAILAVTLGALLVGFEGRWRVGGGLLALGIVLFASAGRRYRRYHDR